MSGVPWFAHSRSARLALLLALTLVVVLAARHVPAVVRAANAGVVDRRAFLGLPNALDVLSNLPFALAGALGLARLGRVPRAQRPAACLVFVAVALATLGSAWYHLAPSRTRLLLDRVPIALAFMALFAWVLGDRLGARVGRRALVPLLLAGAAALWRWHATGELFLYVLVQAVPFALIPVLLVLFAGELRLARFAWALALYAAGKACELFDRELFELGGLVSGHTLKHLLSAGACFALLPGPVRVVRRQLTLFVSEPERTPLDALRARADPVQHALIAAHVTLVRDEDVADWDVVRARLARLEPLPLELELGPPVELEGGALALAARGPCAAFEALRAAFLAGQPGAARAQTPHLTLLHPRNRAHWGLTPAEVRALPLPTRVTLAAPVLIEQEPGQAWRVRPFAVASP